MLAVEIRAATDLREDKKAAQVAADEAGKHKLNADKYKVELDKLKKCVKNKNKDCPSLPTT